MFHISGVLLFPLLILLRQKISQNMTIIIIFMIVVITFALKPILLSLREVIGIFFPIYVMKINNYFIIGQHNQDASMISFIKYLPIYYIAILGIIKRKKYSFLIENYNKYLLLSIMAACLVAYSMVSYWFARFAGLFYLPIFLFYNLLNNRISSRTSCYFNNIIVYGVGIVIVIRKIILIFIN